jgi:hypothetical protein
MGSEEEKTKHSLKRKRNILAKRLRTEREFQQHADARLPKIRDVKPVTREKKLTPRTLEEYLEDDTDNDHT